MQPHLSLSLKCVVIMAMHWGTLLPGIADPWTLSRVIQQASEANPDVLSTRHRIVSAQAALTKARSSLWPRIVAETGYSVTNNPPAVFMAILNQRQLTFDRDFNDPDRTDNWGSELRVEYPLYTGGLRRAGVEAATLGVDAANSEMQAMEHRMALEVTEAYYNVYLARDLLRVADQSLQSLQANLVLAQKLVASNVALQTAVLDLEVKVAEAEVNVEVAQGAFTVQQEYLQMLLGLEKSDEPISVTEEMAKVMPAVSSDQGERHDLVALAKRRTQAEQGVKVVKAGQRPTIGAFASARHDEGFTHSDGGDSWMLGLSLSWNLFDGGETRAEIQDAEAQRKLAYEMERKKRSAIRLEIVKAESNLTIAQARIIQAHKAIKSASESLVLTKARFRNGLSLATQLIDAETAYSNANIGLAQARTEEQIAVAHHRYALGLPIHETSTP